MIRALFATLTNVNFDPQALGQLIDLVHREPGAAEPRLRRLRCALRQGGGL